MLAFLRNLLRSAPRQREDLRFTFITRAGCHLCDDARVLIETAKDRHGFQLDIVDVDASPELVGRYGECVPVVLVNDKLRFRGRVNPVLLQRILDHA